MSLVSFNSVSKDLGGKKILDKVSVELHEGDRVGLIGRNGCGKTTLLRTITGEIQPDSGVVNLKKGMVVGYLPQRPEVRAGRTVWQEALLAFEPIRELERKMAETEGSMASADERSLTRLVEIQANLHEEYERRGGYSHVPRAEAALNGLGLNEDFFERNVEHLSGGEKNRLGLAKILLQEPDLLVLDEPTNYLDLHATQWLEGFLRGYGGAYMLVSHDRYFLDLTVDKIWDHRDGNVTTYKGNYKAYRLQRAERDELHRKEYEQQRREISRQKEFIRRNLAGQKTKQAQGRRKQLERMEKIEAPPAEGERVRIRFQLSGRGGNDVLDLRGLSKAIDGRVLFSDLSFELFRGDRVGIIGSNGTGKSTLIRMILGMTEPSSGEIRLGTGIVVGYYDQEHKDLNPAQTLFEALHEVVPKWTDLEVRNFLAAFLFREEEVFKKLGEASGGESSRVALARIALLGSNFLVLDEPTNHLDLSSRRVLQDALVEYRGTLLMISHDRYLLDKTVDKLLVFEGGEVRLFNGGFTRYAEALLQQSREGRRSEGGQKPGAQTAVKRTEKREKKPKRRHTYQELETKIIEKETEIQRFHADLALEENYKDPERVKMLKDGLERSQSELRQLETEWESWE